MQLTPLLWEDPDVSLKHLRRRLDAHNPDTNPDLAGKADLRGFEWYYYDNLLKNSAALFTGHSSRVLDARVDTGGELITLTKHGQIRHWDLFSKQEDTSRRLELSGGESIASGALAFDGRRAAVIVEKRKTVRVCDTSTGQVIWQLESLGKTTNVCFSSNGKWLVVVDHKVQWLDTNTGNVVGVYHLDLEPKGRVALSHDGKTLAFRSGTSRVIRLCRLDDKAKKADLFGQPIEITGNGALSLAVTPDGDGVLKSLYNHAHMGTFESATSDFIGGNNRSHRTPISAVTIFGDGPQVATAESAGTIRVWPSIDELNSAAPPAMTFKGHSEPVDRLEVSDDGRHLVSISRNEGVRVWDFGEEDAGIYRLPDSSNGNAMMFSSDGSLMVTSLANQIQIWDATTQQPLRKLSVTEKGAVSAIAWSPENQDILAIGCYHRERGPGEDAGYVSLWDITAGKELGRLPGLTDLPNISRIMNGDEITELAFSPDGKFLAVGFGSSYYLPSVTRESRPSPLPMKVYHVETGELQHVLYGHTHWCRDLEFTGDGATMASCSADGTVILWSTDTWEPIHTLNNPDFRSPEAEQDIMSSVESVSFSPDGRMLAMGSYEANIHLWDVESGTHYKTLSGHAACIHSVVFAPDGRTLASGSRDRSIRLWNVSTCQELFKLNDDQLGGRLAFSPDGTKLLGTGDGLAIWSVTPVVKRSSDEVSVRLQGLLASGSDFADSIRLYSKNLQLHEGLAKLSSEDTRVATALAATRANWLASEERWEDAAAEFDRLTKLDPQTPHAWLNDIGLLRLVRGLFVVGRFSDCNKLVAAVTNRVGIYSQVEYRVKLGCEKVENSVVVKTIEPDSTAARAGLLEGDTILSVNGTDVTPGTIHGQLGSRDESIIEILVKRADSGDEELIAVAAERQQRIGELFQPIALLQALAQQQLTVDHDNHAAHEFRGGLFGIQGDFESQVSEYTLAIDGLSNQESDDVDADLARLYRSRADARARAKQWQSAVEDYDRIVTADTADEALLADHAEAKAGVLLTPAVSSSTSLDVAQVKDSWGRLAIAHYLTYNRKELDSVLKRRPRAAEFVGDMLSADGLWRGALSYYDKVVKANVASADVYSKRAEVLERLGRWDDAAASWARATTQRSDHAFRRFKAADTLQWDTTQPNPRVESLKLQFADGVLKFGPKPNSEPRQLRIMQTKLRIENGAKYRLSFRMKSPDKCRVHVQGKRFDRKILPIGLNETVESSPEYQAYQFSFVAENAGSGNSMIRFMIPKDTPGTVMIKDIVFMKISESNVPELDPEKIKDNHVKRAVTFHQSGQLKSLGDVVRKHPRVNVAIGDLYADLNQWRAAISFYSKAIAADSTKIHLLRKRAEAHEKLRQWDQAADDWALASRKQTDISFQRFKSPDDEPWKLWSSKDAQEPFVEIADGVVEFGKESLTKDPWGVRITQRRLRLENGATYMLRFKVKSPDRCRVNVKAQNSRLPDESWLFKTFRAQTRFREYRYKFVATDVDPKKNVVAFDSGRGPGTIMLKDVVLMKIADTGQTDEE